MGRKRVGGRTSSTSGSILMFGSMLRTRSWIERRMLASPGVDLRREDVSSAAHGSSLGFFSADGVPFCITYRTRDRQTDGQTEKHTDTGRDGHTHTHIYI